MPTAMLGRARQLRYQMPSIEQRVWGMLRNGHVDGLKFRRQHPIEPYIVDFYCHRHRLVIEVDGPSHSDRQDYDEKRTRWLDQNGYRVIRFTNLDVLENPNGVRDAIREACHIPSPGLQAARPLPFDLAQGKPKGEVKIKGTK